MEEDCFQIVLPEYMYVYYNCLVSTEAKRVHPIPWNSKYRLLWAIIVNERNQSRVL